VTTSRALVWRHPALTYFVLTFVISWGGALLVIGPGGFPATQEGFDRLLPLAGLALLAGPGVSGVLLTGLVHGRAGLRDVVVRMTRWRVGVRWYAAALLSAPLVFMVVLLALSLTSPVFLPGIFTKDDKAALILLSLVGGLVVGVFEELGWTGFAVPALRRRYGVFATGLVVGLVWGAWHFLLNAYWASGTSLGAGTLPLTTFLIARGLDLLVGLSAFRVLMVWVYDRAGESLLVVMLMHASQTAGTLIVQPVAISGVPLLTYGLALGAVFWVIVAAIALAGAGPLPRRPLRMRAA
jgi:membrane protease YdiL (CAAX protease family)